MALLFLSRISLIISFDFYFVQFIQLWIGIPGPPTLAAPVVALLALDWAHCRWLCLAAARFDLLYQAKATKWCGISNNNWENTKIQKEISVWGLQRVFGWQTWKKINRKIENKTQKWNNWKKPGGHKIHHQKRLQQRKNRDVIRSIDSFINRRCRTENQLKLHWYR